MTDDEKEVTPGQEAAREYARILEEAEDKLRSILIGDKHETG